MSDTKKVENPRKALKEARLAKLKVINGGPGTVKVYAANETCAGRCATPTARAFARRSTRGSNGRTIASPRAAWPKARSRPSPARAKPRSLIRR